MSLKPLRLPDGVHSKILRVRDLNVHVLQAGRDSSPLVLLLHGFPELAFSWRGIIPSLADAGYFVVAPDLRGSGRTRSVHMSPDQQISFDDDVAPYGFLNCTQDIVALTFALGYTTAAAVIGHDFGSALAGYCALIRPDIFKSVVCMSVPYGGPPDLPSSIGNSAASPPSHTLPIVPVQEYLMSLKPPLKHYVVYNSQRSTNRDILDAPQGLHAFLRAYFHMKSADWKGNNPHPLSGIQDLPAIPQYYILPFKSTWPDAVMPHAPSTDEALKNHWLPDLDLETYVEEFGRTGFQGGLNWYRANFNDEGLLDQLRVFAGKKVEVPAIFISGEKDWGVYQIPGSIDRMRSTFTNMADDHVILVKDAGHWVQQERADVVAKHLLSFLRRHGQAQTYA